jgi:ferritin
MWKLIEDFGIKREMLEKSRPNEAEISELYYAIRKSLRDRRDKETIRYLREYVEKLKKRSKIDEHK